MATCVISATTTSMVPAREQTQREESERSIIQRAQNGDEQAFATLFQSHKKRVYSVCLLMTKDVAEAEDLTQEAFLQVFRSIGSFRGDSAFSTWLYRIAVNTVLMKRRRRKAPPALSLDEPVSPDSPTLRHDIGKADPDLCGVVDRLALHRAMEELLKDAARFSPFTRCRDISIMRSPSCWIAPLAIQSRSCTRRR